MGFTDRASRLTDPTSPTFGIASAAITGALTLVDSTTLTGARRRALRTASAVSTGLYTAATVDRHTTVLVPLRAVAGLAAFAISLRFADAEDRLDARLVRALQSAGVRNPRPWLAAGAAGLTFALFLADRAADRKEESELAAIEDLVRLRPISQEARGLLEGILQAADAPGADALLTQLDVAQEQYFDEDLAPDFASTVQFKVPDGVPRAVPHNQVFPVTARYETEDGLRLQVMLQILDGKIDHLAIDAVDDTEEPVEALEDLLAGWPGPDEVEYFIEAADGGTRPV